MLYLLLPPLNLLPVSMGTGVTTGGHGTGMGNLEVWDEIDHHKAGHATKKIKVIFQWWF